MKPILNINTIPYMVECKDIATAKERYKHLGELIDKEIDGRFNALALKENQFFVNCEHKKYYLVTVKP